MTLSLIVAMDECDGIGKDNKLPWSLPNDLAYFQKKTEFKTMIMGRKTYESLPRILKNRFHYVLSSQGVDDSHELVFNGSSVEEMLHLKHSLEEVFVIGGANVYEQFLPHVDRLYVTRVHDIFEVDTTFPKVDWDEWVQVDEQPGKVDEKNKHEHTFYVYHRKGPSQ